MTQTILASLYTHTPLTGNAHMEATHFKKGLPQYQSCSRRILGCMALTETICKSTAYLFLADIIKIYNLFHLKKTAFLVVIWTFKADANIPRWSRLYIQSLGS